MKPRTLLAIWLSLGIIVVWQWGLPKFFPQAAPSAQSQQQQGQIQSVENSKSPTLPSPTTPALALKKADEKKVLLVNNVLQITLSNQGAAIVDIAHIVNKKGKTSTEPVAAGEQNAAYLLLQEPDVLAHADFEVEQSDNRHVVFVGKAANGVKVRKTFALSDSYDMTLAIEILNQGADVLSMKDGYVLTLGPSLICGNKKEASAVVLKSQAKQAESFTKISQREVIYGDPMWVGQTNKYFAVLLKPLGAIQAAYVEPLADQHVAASLRSKDLFLKPGERSEDKYVLYAGPKLLQQLKSYPYSFEKVVNFGFFNTISLWLLKLLNFFYSLTHNYGVAIILLTILVKIILFPLSQKSFLSMQKMQKLQGHMKGLQQRYKDNPQKLHMETLQLYKKHNIHPLGCLLPMILQMPVFFALFWVLQSAYELRSAHFIFWIDDLSQKDPTYVLPIVMGATMVLQQLLTPNTGDPQQRRMMLIMPVIFTFFFLQFPSGLVLYWLVNNIVSMIHQKWVLSREK